jgi:WD40 repeat protein
MERELNSNGGLYEFDQNYMVGTSGTDGVIKVWNMYDLEHCLNFIVPKEECLCIAMHQFKPYMICSFSDGYMRFFDLQDSRCLGRCLVRSPNEELDPT